MTVTEVTSAGSAATTPAAPSTQVLVADLGVPVCGHLEEALVEALELCGAVRRNLDGDLPRVLCGVLLGDVVFG